MSVSDFDFLMPSEEELKKLREDHKKTSQTSPNRFEHWFSTVKKLNIPHPYTEMLDTPFEFSESMFSETTTVTKDFDGNTEAYLDKLASQVKDFGERRGYPIFVRNSFTSGKHSWKDSCFIKEEESISAIKERIYQLTESSLMGPGLAPLKLVLREFIDTKPAFHAFHGNTPITQEFRLFFDNGKPVKWQAYWPETSIQEPDCDDWKEKLKNISEPNDELMAKMKHYAKLVTEELEGYWSVDFLIDNNGKPWLIDMADGHASYTSKDAKIF